MFSGVMGSGSFCCFFYFSFLPFFLMDLAGEVFPSGDYSIVGTGYCVSKPSKLRLLAGMRMLLGNSEVSWKPSSGPKLSLAARDLPFPTGFVRFSYVSVYF